MKVIKSIVLIVVILVAIRFLIGSSGERSSSLLDREVETLEGETVNLQTYLDRPLIVNSWAAWCSFCKEELPDFVKLQAELGDDATVIALNRGESAEEQLEFLEAEDLLSGLTYLIDIEDQFYRDVGGLGMPATAFISKDGEVISLKQGFMNINEMRDRASQLFK